MEAKERDELIKAFVKTQKERDRRDIPALSYALMQDRLDVVAALIDQGVDVNQYAKRPAWERGMAPIHFAQSPEAVRMLAKAGADVDAPYKHVDHAWGRIGETQLQTLALTGDHKALPMIEALIEAGADRSRPFAKEFHYPKDSDIGIDRQVVRGGKTIETEISRLQREKSELAAELDDLLSTTPQQKGVDKAPALEKPMDKISERELDFLLSPPARARSAQAENVVERDDSVERAKPVVERAEISAAKPEPVMNFIERDDSVEQTKQVDVRNDTPLIKDAGSNAELAKDDSFVSWLNMRMKSADWETYERSSEAFLGIDHDLEKLGKVDAEMARGLWKENTPPGTALPFYLTPEFEKAARAQRDPEQGKVPEVEEKAPVEPQKRSAEPERSEGFRVPEEIKRRYLDADNKFYFRDQKNKLAFEDRGRKMVTEHNDPDVAKSLVDLAAAKGWDKIKVSGHDDFKSEVWLQATLKGIEVKGYQPKELDLAKLREFQSARAKNSVERDEGRDVQGQKKGKEAQLSDEERAYAEPGYDKAANFKGKLLEHGRAHYDFDEKKEQSYFVKLETENGTKTHWGVDLGRAMDYASAKLGEMIELERLGKRPVTVQEKQFDPAGNLIGHKPVETERVEWRVGGLEQSKGPIKAADVVVNGSTEKVVQVEKPKAPSPEREQASNTPTAGKSAPVAAKVPGLKGDYRVPVDVFAEVLKEKGYSAKTIERAQAEATKRLSVMAEKGQPAPGVKVFDRSAARERPREKIISKSKDQQQERSR